MSKAEAQAAIERGEKVTHTYFTTDEFVTVYEHDRYYYLFEDGVKQRAKSFWEMRTQKGWDDGWSIYTEN